MSRSRAGAVLLAARPKTLTAALVPVMVGTALTHAARFPVRWPLALYALLGAGAIQIGTYAVLCNLSLVGKMPCGNMKPGVIWISGRNAIICQNSPDGKPQKSKSAVDGKR